MDAGLRRPDEVGIADEASHRAGGIIPPALSAGPSALPSRHGGRRPAIHDCAPGMALISEVQVLYGPMA